jgi:hypothetical protein
MTDKDNKAKRLLEALEAVRLACAQAALRVGEYEQAIIHEVTRDPSGPER